MAQIIRGITFPSSDKNTAPTKGAILFLRTSNIQESVEWDDVLYVPRRYVKNNDRWLQIHDTLKSMANSYELVGKVALVSTIPEKDVSFGGFIAAIRSMGIDKRFLFYVLREPSIKEAIRRTASRTVNIANISAKNLNESTFPIAPLAEQKRIVAKIEALQERSRRAREALAEVKPLLEQFRHSVLAAAFRGDLTADWRAKNPDVEPASELLKRIRAERRKKWEAAELAKYKAKNKQPPKGWQDKYQEPEQVNDSELPGLPEGWCWCQLGLLGADPLNTVQTGPFGAQLHTDEFVVEGIPVIAVGNLTGVGFTEKNLYFITKEKAQQLNRYDVQAGDVLFARSGATLGKVCVVPDFVSDWRMTGHILRARLNSNFVLPEIAVYALWGDATVKNIVSGGIRGMTRPGYNTSLLNAIPLPLAPIAEQRQMLELIAAGFDFVERGFTLRSDSATDLAQLDQSILAKAFRGELVPQDPNDEPASVLLERIRQQREAAGPKLRSKRGSTVAAESAKVDAQRQQRLDRGKVVLNMLLLLEAWEKPVSLIPLENALSLMETPDLLKTLGKTKSLPAGTQQDSTSIIFRGLDFIYANLVTKSVIKKVGNHAYQLIDHSKIAAATATQRKAARDAISSLAELMKRQQLDDAGIRRIIARQLGRPYELQTTGSGSR